MVKGTGRITEVNEGGGRNIRFVSENEGAGVFYERRVVLAAHDKLSPGQVKARRFVCALGTPFYEQVFAIPAAEFPWKRSGKTLDRREAHQVDGDADTTNQTNVIINDKAHRPVEYLTCPSSALFLSQSLTGRYMFALIAQREPLFWRWDRHGA
jgi:hypothetical protein